MTANKSFTAVAAIVCTTVLWGLSFSSTKVLLGTLIPEQIAFFRLVLAAAVLGGVFLATGRQKVKPGHALRMAAGGIAGIFLYFLFENNGLRFTTAGTGSLIVSTIPVLNVIAGRLFFAERQPGQRWLGVLLSFAGVYLIVRFGSGNDLALANMKGNVLVFLAACAWVAYTRINEPLLRSYSSLTVNFYQSLTGMFFLGLLAVPRGIDWTKFTVAVTLNLAYLGLFCSAAAFFLYLYALKNLSSTTATTFLNLVPVFGVIGGVIILGEVLAAGQLTGAVMVVLGVSLVTAAGIKKEKGRAQAPMRRESVKDL